MAIDNLFYITTEDISKANKGFIEYGKIKKENPSAYELLLEQTKKLLKNKGIEITKEDVIETNKKLIGKYK
jgi:hypothetical protein